MSDITSPKKNLVNPVATANCTIVLEDRVARVLDISLMRLVIEDEGVFSDELLSSPLPFDFFLERYRFSAIVKFQARGAGWMRFGIEKLLHKASADLRSFLSPKRIGESILEDWRNGPVRHYHGLGESELWIEQSGGMLFSYLDFADKNLQFIVRVSEDKGPILRVGKLPREDYIGLATLEQELPLIPLNDKELYLRLGECRDVVTNFRPTGQLEYNLKQRLLKILSENLYSTSRRVEMIYPRTPVRMSSSSPNANDA
jgi:hypothetical protein